ncbi:hypothetical protein P7K49_014786 [Saguinus oedipus]|uniref:Uncharacterized protein n=1 Tax=Saguinus oedipus TaxID=9490 RepID=A0ABQ9V7C9_SAGOE|nr:hypothetical protein P7K49_014786 [Saguinus oedipus]
MLKRPSPGLILYLEDMQQHSNWAPAFIQASNIFHMPFGHFSIAPGTQLSSTEN